MSRSQKTEDEKRSHSERLRAVLFKNWEKDNEKYALFEDYYHFKMEMIINHFKDKLK